MNKAIAGLLETMRALRHPETGCPWDREQTMTSILPYTLEEVYELVDAVERGEAVDIRDELGDLLFHVVFCCSMSSITRRLPRSKAVSISPAWLQGWTRS